MAQASKTISKPRLYAALAAAGFCGAVLRFCVQSLPFGVVAGFPLGTLLANTLGSFLIFLVFNHGVVRGGLSAAAVKVINTGFMGAFTTMSAVGTDAIALVNSGNSAMSCGYVAITLVLTFGAALLAAWLCRGGDKA